VNPRLSHLMATMTGARDERQSAWSRRAIAGRT
jgi:hypothetical protein